MIGRSFIFKIVIPVAQEMDRLKKEEQEAEQAVLEDHLAEIVDYQSEEFEQARTLISIITEPSHNSALR